MRTLAVLLALTIPAWAQTTTPKTQPAPIAVQPMTAPPAPFRKIALPPPEFSGPLDPSQQVNILRMADYGVIQYVCKSKTAIACTIFNRRECVIMLGPKVWDDDRAMAHERAHCAGWPSDHPNPKYE